MRVMDLDVHAAPGRRDDGRSYFIREEDRQRPGHPEVPVEDVPVEGVDDEGHSGPPGGQPSQRAGLRRVDLGEDVGLLAAVQDVARWQVDYYSKISFPFASVIVVLFGVPFSSIKRRGGVGVQLGISLLICFIYLIIMKVSQVFGYNGDMNPLLTAWLANIIFFLAGVYNLWRVPK